MDSRRYLVVFAFLFGCFDPETPSGEDSDGSSGGTAGTTPGVTTTSNTVTTANVTTSGPMTGSSGGPTTMTATTDDTDTSPTTGVTSTTDTTDPTDTSSSSSSGSSSSGSSSSSTSGVPDACGMDELCVEPAPVGWDGPAARFIVAGAGAPIACADPFPTELEVGYVDFSFSDAECMCDCATPTNATCSGSGVAVYSDSVCGTAVNGGTMTTACSSLGAGFDSYTVGQPDVNGGTCTVQFGETLPPTVLTNARTLCRPDTPPPACVGASGLCLPETPDAQFCVSSAGDVDCPAASVYSTKELIASSLDDSRGCSQCTCGGAEGTCDGTASLFSGGGCTGANTLRAADDSCYSEPSPGSGRLVITGMDASCPPIGGNPLGTVIADEVTTLCCAMF